MKLTKAQIEALAKAIYQNIDFEKLKENAFKDWYKSDKSLEYRKHVKPAFLKAKELIEKYGFDRIIYMSENIDSSTTEFDFVTYRYGRDHDWKFNYPLIQVYDIQNDIVLASIDAKTVDEITNKINKKYEY